MVISTIIHVIFIIANPITLQAFIAVRAVYLVSKTIEQENFLVFTKRKHLLSDVVFHPSDKYIHWYLDNQSSICSNPQNQIHKKSD